MAKVLVIGGTGLISTAIVRQLVERGDEVTVYNRGKTEPRIPPEVSRVIGDRKDFPNFEKQVQELGHFDAVIDMVCYVPDEAESVIRAFRGRIEQLIFCSTVDVYNKPAVFYPYREDHPRQAASEYGRNKARCEDILLRAHEQGAFKVTIIRPAHTYGEGGTLIHTFGWRTTYLDRLRKGKPIIQHGDGNSLWVACHIDDVARAFVNAIGNERAYGKAYHTTGEEWLPWNRYHELIAEAMGAPKPQIVHIPTDLLVKLVPDRVYWTAVNFQFSNVFDNTAAKNDLGFRYTIPFKEGARRTVQWLEERGRIEDCANDPVYDWIIDLWERLGEGMRTELSRRVAQQRES